MSRWAIAGLILLFVCTQVNAGEQQAACSAEAAARRWAVLIQNLPTDEGALRMAARHSRLQSLPSLCRVQHQVAAAETALDSLRRPFEPGTSTADPASALEWEELLAHAVSSVGSLETETLRWVSAARLALLGPTIDSAWPDSFDKSV